jgi:magnesium-transporting ATPase (P-type)
MSHNKCFGLTPYVVPCWFVCCALQLLWVNLIMDTLGALALATETPSSKLLVSQKAVIERVNMCTCTE